MLMKYQNVFATLLIIIFISACSDQQNIPVGPSTIEIHQPGWADKTSDNFHGDEIAASNFNMESCQQCHGADYGGGLVESSCLTCHSQDNGPEACNTCHGVFAASADDLANVAPPGGLAGETAVTERAVGAHQQHLSYYPDLTTTCNECHKLPQSLNDAGHLDATTGAEVVFGGTLAVIVTEGGSRIPQVQYNTSNATCANTYCHGNWVLEKSNSNSAFVYLADKMEGNFSTASWVDASTAECGSCHALPPTGHIASELTGCGNCHSGVVDDQGKIIDNGKHINGKVNVFGQEYDMF
ncbi:MAG: hypothetical protein DWQ05_20105 [Calditrichaeota bacterium]|nr:MAG: hypothetical protein DWQ05_20105 [Calditrichota bacterium]